MASNADFSDPGHLPHGASDVTPPAASLGVNNQYATAWLMADSLAPYGKQCCLVQSWTFIYSVSDVTSLTASLSINNQYAMTYLKADSLDPYSKQCRLLQSWTFTPWCIGCYATGSIGSYDSGSQLHDQAKVSEFRQQQRQRVASETLSITGYTKVALTLIVPKQRRTGAMPAA